MMNWAPRAPRPRRPGRVVHQSAWLERAEHAEEHADELADDHGGDGQLEGYRQRRPHQDATDVREVSEDAQVAREDGAQPRAELLEKRLAHPVVVVEGDRSGRG